MLGPTGYSSAQAALEVYEGAGMPLLTVSELSTSAASSAIAGTAPRSYFRAAPLSAYGALATVTALSAGVSASWVCWATGRAGWPAWSP